MLVLYEDICQAKAVPGFICSARTWLATCGVNTHSAATGAGFTTIEFARLLRRVLVSKVDEGSSLRLSSVVGQHANTLWLDVVLQEYLFDILLAAVTEASHKDRVLLVRSATATATTVASTTASI